MFDSSRSVDRLFASIVALGASLVTIMSGCKTSGISLSVTQISVEALRDSLTAQPNLLLVDVRMPSEWESVRAQGIKKFIEHDQISGRANELGSDTTTPVYLICRSGHRSLVAAEAQAKMGYKHLLSVKGGTNAWVAAGFPADSGSVAGVSP